MKNSLRLIILLLAIVVLSACTHIEAGVTADKEIETPATKPVGTPATPAPSLPDPLAVQLQTLLKDAEGLRKGYFYEEALTLLASFPRQEADIDKLKAAIMADQGALVKYEGQPYHVFFHSLIVYPQLAFDNKGHSAQGYNTWMTTQSEFIKMLPLLQENGFVLYDIENLYTRNPDGTITKRDIYLPAGKKPLILSQDDVNYYEYMKADGFASRLVVDANGRVATEIMDLDGKLQTTYDGDVAPILDAYVKQHPEFSFRGAKGILAVTGYEGAFGYRLTDLEGAALEEARAQVRNLVSVLRSSGWKIANHSYTHNGYFSPGTATMAQLKDDTQKWKKHIAPYVGDPKIYISPFGYHMKNTDPRFRYLVSQGYDIFCPVEKNNYTWFYADSVIQSRFNLDGFNMFKRPDFVSQTYFDVSKVLDPARPTPDW